MNTEIKNALISSYYQDILKKEYEANWAEKCPHLEAGLIHLYQLDGEAGFLDLDNLDREASKTQVLLSMLQYFDQNYKKQDQEQNFRFLDEAYEYEQFYETSNLPGAQYTDRAIPPEQECDDLALYREEALAKLNVFIEQNPSNKLKEDYKKIKNLKKVLVPDEHGTMHEFYTLAESAGGVTEKVSLISKDFALDRVRNLAETEMTRQEYLTHRDDYKLSTQAILKLPKRGNIKEVQRELIALNVSQIMGFRTTERTAVEYSGRPALFVPFDQIELMKEFAHGETKTIHMGTKIGDKYLHYSTMKPVGEGLCAEQTIDDPGLSLSFYYLCSDTDAFGGYNQNKALYGAKEWYVFDQVVMSDDKLALDSRISMQPSQTLMKHSRHGQGRNRTLVEDSSFENKFASLFHLQSKRIKINAMMGRIITQHQQAIEVLESKGKLNKKESQRLSDLIELRKDAKKIRTVMQNRIDSVLSVLPQVENESDTVYGLEDIKNIQMHGLMLEKLLNKPVLFSKDGRPYRQPWTYRPVQQLSEITLLADEETVQLKFSKSIDESMIAWINHALGDDAVTIANSKTLRMSLASLQKINDRILFPEHQTQYKPGHNYLNIPNLKILAGHYGSGKQNALVLGLVNNFVSEFNSLAPLNNNIESFEQALEGFAQLKASHKENGFICHVEKCFHYDMQQRLQSLIDTVPVNMFDAFEAAVKLDRLVEFNKVCLEAVKNGKAMDTDFIEFLTDCIQLGQAVDYHQAKDNSATLSDNADRCIQALQAEPELGLGSFHGGFFAHNHQLGNLGQDDKPGNSFGNS